jgi:hypothetical protein
MIAPRYSAGSPTLIGVRAEFFADAKAIFDQLGGGYRS